MDWTLERSITITAVAASLVGSYFILRLDWKRYGLLFVLSGIVGNILCYLFVIFGFYSYPYRMFPQFVNMPIMAVLTVFPFYVLLGVRYSPREWAWKIPFYWVFVHVGMLLETIAQHFTGLIRYEFAWDVWDSYTWWWIYLLAFEWIGGLIIPDRVRKPLKVESFRYGRGLWATLHFILIITIFLAGFYLGWLIRG
ncbi:MAG: hypothetical protein H0Z33_02795 [Bacillaceae bacterium]|nr:hypothetical protein [Bacillaceae bacterium]